MGYSLRSLIHRFPLNRSSISKEHTSIYLAFPSFPSYICISRQLSSPTSSFRTIYYTAVEKKSPPPFIKMLALILFFLSLLGHVVSLPTTDKDLVVKDTNLIDDPNNATIVSRALPIYGISWQYNREECIWVRQFNPVVTTTCTEYCMAGLSGYRSRLRYHM